MDNKTPTLLKNGTVFTKDACFEKLDISFSDGKINNISTSAKITCEREIDCSDCYVIPALTDIHFHGCCGYDLCDASADSLKAIAEYEYSCGVTQICPATMTIPESELEAVLKAAAEYSTQNHKNCAELVGIHLEGPFISPEKVGAQKAECISLPSLEKLDKWQKTADELIKLVTIAPEVSGALGMIEQAADRFHFSLGHSSSGYSSALKAFNAGADHVTHLFNAMEPFHHRDTGIIGAAADSDCYIELICDGVHVSPSAVRMAFRLFSDDRIVLISDSMEATGMKDGTYRLGGQQVTKHGARQH